MRKILVLYPHFPPSNLAGVHRPRLFAQHLPSFGWEPVILTVNEKYYEEDPDRNLVKLLPPGLRIEKVNALPVTNPRILGDIGLRAFFSLYKKAKQIIGSEPIDFLYIPIPSFYCALLGRWLHASTGIKYGIDYIDPWVHYFPGSEKVFSRHWLSTRLAMFLEPIAVKKASLITGVAEGYYQPVLERNPHLKTQAITGAMPYGGEIADHRLLQQLRISPYLFQKEMGKIQLVYAGAMLPKAYGLLEKIFEIIALEKEIFKNIVFHFIGTGKTANDAEGYNLKPLAQKYGLWETNVFEYPKRIPYMDVLVHLGIADGIFILGSTEPHYTPSKTYQGVLSEKPILAVLHQQSTAVAMLVSANAGVVFSFDEGNYEKHVSRDFGAFFIQYLSYLKTFKPEEVNKAIFDKYSAKNVTGLLAALLNQTLTQDLPV
jgi:hypothetical protein